MSTGVLQTNSRNHINLQIFLPFPSKHQAFLLAYTNVHIELFIDLVTFFGSTNTEQY